jgi:hypothetical protein
MADAVRFHDRRDAVDMLARLRPANIQAAKPASQPAGPFEVPVDTGNGSSLREALMTGLLVIYPAVATVAAIVAGLFLAGTYGA